MFFKKKNPWVRFVNAMPGAVLAHPIIRSQNYNFNWYKEAASNYKIRQQEYEKKPNGFLISTTRCPGLHQFFKSGFIVTAPLDFTIETRKDKPGLFKWECPFNAVFDGREYIGAHTPDQLSQFMPFREDTLSSLIKVHTRWRIYSSPDIVFLQLPIAYPDHNMFTAAHGVIDCQVLLEMNVQLFWHKLEGIHLVKAGTPLCHLVPIPRELSVDMQIDSYTKEDRYNEQAYEYLANVQWNKDIKKFYDSCKKLLGK